MQYAFPQIAATVALLAFSVGLGCLSLRYFGFGAAGLRNRVFQYEKRRQTALGKKAHRPLLIRHVEDPWQVFGRVLLPLILNSAILLVFWLQGIYALVLILVLPLGLAEFILAWHIQRKHVSRYQRDLDEYLRLTAVGNCSLDGQVMDWDVLLPPSELISSRLLSGGKIVTLSANRNGQLRSRRLFYPFSDVPLPPSDCSVRVFYAPQKEIYGKEIDGTFLGYQMVACGSEHRDKLSFGKRTDNRTAN